MTDQKPVSALLRELSGAFDEPWYCPGDGEGIWVETAPACGGPDPQPPEGEQIAHFVGAASATRVRNALPKLADAVEALEKIREHERERYAIQLAALEKARRDGEVRGLRRAQEWARKCGPAFMGVTAWCEAEAARLEAGDE